MADSTQLQNLRAQLEVKRKKVIGDPDIPSQKLDLLIKEMNTLYSEIQQLEIEVSKNEQPDTHHHT